MNLEAVKQLYIAPGAKGKTHLGFLSNKDGTYSEVLYWICFPNSPMRVQIGCLSLDSFERDCNKEDTEYFDALYNEVTCPTCLKIASTEIGKQMKECQPMRMI